MEKQQQKQQEQVQVAIQPPKVDGLKSFINGLPENWTKDEVRRLHQSQSGQTLFRAISFCVNRTNAAAASKKLQQQHAAAKPSAAPRIQVPHTRNESRATIEKYDVVDVLNDIMDSAENDASSDRQLQALVDWDDHVQKFNFGCIAMQSCPDAWKGYFQCMKQAAAVQQRIQKEHPATYQPSHALLALTSSCHAEKRIMESCVGRTVMRATQVANGDDEWHS